MTWKKVLSSAAAAAIFIGCFPASVQVSAKSADPIINVTFDNSSDSYTLFGNASLADGRSGKALSLTGADGGYATINASAKMKTLTDDFTVSVWFKPNSTSLWARVFDLGTGKDVYTFLTVSAGAYPRFAIKNGIEQSMDSDTVFSVGEWHNASISRSGDTTTMYIDGFKVGTSTALTYKFSELASFTQCYLGKSQWPDPYFDGMIDDFKVYGSALSESEIQELAAEAYTEKLYEKIHDKNCFVSDTHFYDTSGNELLAFNSGTVNIKSTLENDTFESASLSVSAYAVDENGTETLLGSSNTVTLSSASSKTVSFNVSPSGAKRITVKLNTPDDSYTAAMLYGDVTAPVAAPADSSATTMGAHDPSIVKFDGDDTYYVYSSHHLIFTSTDLINWTKYDFTNIDASVISPVTSRFISNNYTNTTMNTTYWAPDVIYVPNDDHPYWMYISLSCGLGGRNSAISLMKSDSPLFWADPEADIIDAGVVFATKEVSGYKTNAIDANIYTDSNDGKRYFIWGSFWGGIQAAPLTADGFVEGIDYTSDSSILNSCKNFGTTVFSQKNGVAGPEGAWMHENGGYRYMFTSYGWLGSNYNTRIARSALSGSFGTDMGTQLKDANNVIVGTQYDKGSTSSPSGYKLIGSYRLGSGSMTVTNANASNYYVPYSSGDAHIYYGSGHNSAITAKNGESFYCSHFRKDYVEGAAILQIRKMMYMNGWPVVSPVSYAGEKEQALPREMLVGTYDLASVGKMKMDGSSIASSGTYINRNYDLPVLSSKVTLNADGTMANSLGTWEFDGNHTVTLRFAKNGNASIDQYYKSGDVMTMYALFGYDKDERQPCIALTGIDQNYVTQFAKKIISSVYYSPSFNVEEPKPDISEDVSSDFNSVSAVRIMYIETTDQSVNTAYPGADLYIGTRSNGSDSTSNWSIESGAGVNGTNALVLNSGKFVSASRGPRVQITNPKMPAGYMFTGSFKVKLGSAAAELFYGDSTSVQAANALSGKLSSSEWKTVKVIITNDDDTFSRTMYVDEEEIFTDSVGSFPVFWGTATNEKYCKVYFDDFAVKTEALFVPTSITYNSGKIYINGTSPLGTARLFEAVYNEHRALQRVHIYDNLGTNRPIDVDTVLSDGETVRFMLWDGNMMSLADSI